MVKSGGWKPLPDGLARLFLLPDNDAGLPHLVLVNGDGVGPALTTTPVATCLTFPHHFRNGGRGGRKGLGQQEAQDNGVEDRGRQNISTEEVEKWMEMLSLPLFTSHWETKKKASLD